MQERAQCEAGEAHAEVGEEGAAVEGSHRRVTKSPWLRSAQIRLERARSLEGVFVAGAMPCRH